MSDVSVNYQVIQSISIEDAMKASTKSTSASRTVDKSDGTVWNQTVASLMETFDFSGFEKVPSKEGIEALRKALAEEMATQIMASVTIPETGKDRNGKDILLAKKDKTIKWASWDQTRRIFAYIGDIAKIYMHNMDSILYPDQYKVGARCDVLKLCKVEKSPLELIKQFTESTQAQIDKIDNSADLHSAFKAVEALSLNVDIQIELNSLIGRLDSLLGVAEQVDKDAVKASLIQVATKHLK